MTVSHHSFATRATEQRLELLNGRDDYRVTFAIEDLYSDNEAAGTQVNITITADVKDKLTQKVRCIRFFKVKCTVHETSA
ncbi:MAG: hypothetical protein IPM74_15925 [Crocinitomicaceae bacterium]|nr:hypothetical protein [Crocinitomicaceae bacterium]